ncbi:MAG TPA: hypothetical protein VK617_08650 [Gemmatimonadaceae bacterium]|nr:hypothetical protein [Gemmatimonadaceae bacterium]
MQGISHTMTRVGVAVIVVAALACTASAPPPVMLGDTRTPLQRMADSTERLVGAAAQMSDSAVVWVGLAATDTVLSTLRARLLTTREAVDRATTRLTEAAQQGEKVRLAIIEQTRGSRQADDYEHYWLLGREKLILARAYSAEAVASADSALVCPQAACVTSRARLLHTQVNSASGAAREAESLVRVAMRFVY